MLCNDTNACLPRIRICCIINIYGYKQIWKKILGSQRVGFNHNKNNDVNLTLN